MHMHNRRNLEGARGQVESRSMAEFEEFVTIGPEAYRYDDIVLCKYCVERREQRARVRSQTDLRKSVR